MSAEKPNIVMILTDDHASHAVGAYGSVVNTTPRIDEIAAAGFVLENCFATNSLCSPSRASILTGTYSHRDRRRPAHLHHRTQGSGLPHGYRGQVAYGRR